MAADGFTYCNRVAPGANFVIGIAGASNARGNNAATGNPASLGYSLPTGAKFYEDSTTLLTSYPTTHFGPEVGLIDYLVNTRGIAAARITVVKHGVPGSDLTNWINTSWGELNGYFATTGYAQHYLMLQGSADASASGAANAYRANMRDIIGRFRRDRGDGIGITWGLTNSTLSLVDKPYLATVLAAQAAEESVCQGLMTLNFDDLATDPTDPEDKHYTGASQIIIGQRYGAQLFEDLVLIS